MCEDWDSQIPTIFAHFSLTVGWFLPLNEIDSPLWTRFILRRGDVFWDDLIGWYTPYVQRVIPLWYLTYVDLC